MITNAHVVGYSPVVNVDWPGLGTYSGNVINRDRDRDLAAILVVTSKVMPSVRLSSTHPTRGLRIVQIGYPLGKGPAAKIGQVDGYDGVKGFGKRNMLLSFNTIDGDSGSGVFDRSTQKVVGIVWGKTMGGSFAGNGLAVELEDVRKFTETCFLKRPWLKRPQQPADPPIYWPPPVNPSPDKINDLDGKLSDIEKQIEALRKLRDEMGDLAKGLSEPPTAPKKSVPDSSDKKPLDRKIAIVKEVAGFSWPWILGALGIGVGGGAGIPLVIKGVSALVRRRVKVSGTPDDKLAALKDSIERLVKSRVEQSPKPATAPTSSSEPKQTDMKFVPYEGGNDELEALNEAMEKIVHDFPGTVGTLEQLRSYAKQILSGKKRGK